MPRTQQLLAAIGDPDGFALLEVLERAPHKQTRLAETAGVPTGTASGKIDVLVALGVVRRPSARGELSITHPAAFRAVLDAADQLTEVLLRDDIEEHARRSGRDHERDE
jgi:DNA-binding IclR family transcriptional regulator